AVCFASAALPAGTEAGMTASPSARRRERMSGASVAVRNSAWPPASCQAWARARQRMTWPVPMRASASARISSGAGGFIAIRLAARDHRLLQLVAIGEDLPHGREHVVHVHDGAGRARDAEEQQVALVHALGHWADAFVVPRLALVELEGGGL